LFLSVKSHPSGLFLQPPGSTERWVSGAEYYFPAVIKSFDGWELILELGPYFSDAYVDKFHFFYLRSAKSPQGGDRDNNADFPVLRVETNRIKKPPRELANIDLPDQKAKFASPAVEEVTLMNRTEKVDSNEGSAALTVGLGATLETPPAHVAEPEPSPPPETLIGSLDQPPPPVPEQSEALPLPASVAIPKTLANRPEGEAQKSVKPAAIILGLLALLLIVGGVLVFLKKAKIWDEEKSPNPKANLEEKTDPPVAPLKASDLEDDGAKTPDPKIQNPAKPPLDEARDLLRKGASNADLAAAVARLDGQPGAEDAVFLLLRKLAPTSPGHRLRFAAFYDPLDKRPSGTVAKNAKFAFDEYEEARKAGDKEAAARQMALLDWAEANEKSGDAGAKALLEMLDNGL
jgi:hypothetical protein